MNNRVNARLRRVMRDNSVNVMLAGAVGMGFSGRFGLVSTVFGGLLLMVGAVMLYYGVSDGGQS